MGNWITALKFMKSVSLKAREFSRPTLNVNVVLEKTLMVSTFTARKGGCGSNNGSLCCERQSYCSNFSTVVDRAVHISQRSNPESRLEPIPALNLARHARFSVLISSILAMVKIENEDVDSVGLGLGLGLGFHYSRTMKTVQKFFHN